MFASEESYMLGISYFQSHQQTDSLQRIKSLIYVVTQENILVAFHFVLVGKTKTIE